MLKRQNIHRISLQTHPLLFSAVKFMEFRKNGLYKEFLCRTQSDTI